MAEVPATDPQAPAEPAPQPHAAPAPQEPAPAPAAPQEPAQDPASTDDAVFHDAFAEFAVQKPEDEPKPPAPETPPAGDPPPEAPPLQAPPAGEPPGATQEPSAQAPQGPAPAEPAPQTPQEDIWASATPEQRAAVVTMAQHNQRLEQESRSNRGRLSKIMRENPEFFSDQRGPAPGAPSIEGDQTGGQDPATGEDPGGDKATPFATTQWTEFAKDYPDIAAPIKDIVAGLHDHNQSLYRQVQEISTGLSEEYMDRQEDALTTVHADWREVTRSQPFTDWLREEPKYVQEGAIANADAIVDAAGAAHLLTRFKQETGAAPPPPPLPQPPQTPAATGGRPTQPLGRQRRRRLAAVTPTPQRGTGAGGGPPDDFESSFAYYARQPQPAP